MGGSLLLAASEGIDVVLVVFTDGSLGERRLMRAKFVRLREQERPERQHCGYRRSQSWWIE